MLAPCHLRYWSWQPAFRCLLFGRKIYFLWVKWIYGQFYASVKIYEFFNGRRNIENLNFITSLGDNIQLPTLNMTNPSANCGTHIIECNLLYFNLILRTFHLLILAPSLVTCQKQRFCLVSQTINCKWLPRTCLHLMHPLWSGFLHMDWLSGTKTFTTTIYNK